MQLTTIEYQNYEKELPQEGNHILAQQTSDTLIVYQAFNPQISTYAVQNQHFGGNHYSFNRMSWIKPNFLWMMYRCGWASKVNQQRVLAIELRKVHFEEVLAQAVHSSFKSDVYASREAWQEQVKQSEVRLQWDPDHDPFGTKLQRRAIQLGLRGEMLEKFGKEWILSIEDITDFVVEQGKKVQAGDLSNLQVMKEEVVAIQSRSVREKLQIF